MEGVGDGKDIYGWRMCDPRNRGCCGCWSYLLPANGRIWHGNDAWGLSPRGMPSNGYAHAHADAWRTSAADAQEDCEV